MKKPFYFLLLILLVLVTSCQTRVVSLQKPFQPNSLELYKNYTVVTVEPKQYKVQVLKVEGGKIYGKNKNGENVEINVSDVREVRKTDWVSSVVIGIAAVAAVIFIPI